MPWLYVTVRVLLGLLLLLLLGDRAVVEGANKMVGCRVEIREDSSVLEKTFAGMFVKFEWHKDERGKCLHLSPLCLHTDPTPT